MKRVLVVVALAACGSRSALDGAPPPDAGSPPDAFPTGTCEWNLARPPSRLTDPPGEHVATDLAITPTGALFAYTTNPPLPNPRDYLLRAGAWDGSPTAPPVTTFSGPTTFEPGFSWSIAWGEGRGAAIAYVDGACRFVPLDATGATAGPFAPIVVAGSCGELTATTSGFQFLDESALATTVAIVSVDPTGAVLSTAALAWSPQADPFATRFDTDADGSLWLTWQDSASDGATCAAIQKFRSDGAALTGRIQLGPCALMTAFTLPVTIATSAGRLVMWRDGFGVPSSQALDDCPLSAALLDSSGGFVAGPAHLSDRLVTSNLLTLVVSGDDVLAQWIEGGNSKPQSNVVLGVLTPSGALREPPRVLYTDRYLAAGVRGLPTPLGAMFVVRTAPQPASGPVVFQVESIAVQCTPR
jgi:hypothetical protein